MALLILSIVAAIVLVALVAVLLTGWGGSLTLAQRIGLAALAAGLVLAAVPRFRGDPPGLGDVLMLGGFVVYLVATHGPAIWTHVDALDGTVDGRVGAQPAADLTTPPHQP